MKNLNKSEQTLVQLMRERIGGFMMPSPTINMMLKDLERKMVAYSLPDTTGQMRWYLQDDYL